LEGEQGGVRLSIRPWTLIEKATRARKVQKETMNMSIALRRGAAVQLPSSGTKFSWSWRRSISGSGIARFETSELASHSFPGSGSEGHDGGVALEVVSLLGPEVS